MKNAMERSILKYRPYFHHPDHHSGRISMNTFRLDEASTDRIEPPGRNPHLEEAYDYYRSMGLTLIPITRHFVPLRGNTFKGGIVDHDRARRSIDDISCEGIAVLLGEPSGGLVCRNFFDPETYRDWCRRFPEESERLPTCLTYYGAQVFARTQYVPNFRSEGWELRAQGLLVALPPSALHDSMISEWTINIGTEFPEVGLEVMDDGQFSSRLMPQQQSLRIFRG
jgi:hypothetical protein